MTTWSPPPGSSLAQTRDQQSISDPHSDTVLDTVLDSSDSDASDLSGASIGPRLEPALPESDVHILSQSSSTSSHSRYRRSSPPILGSSRTSHLHSHAFLHAHARSHERRLLRHTHGHQQVPSADADADAATGADPNGNGHYLDGSLTELTEEHPVKRAPLDDLPLDLPADTLPDDAVEDTVGESPADALVTQVIQTVSLVQIVNSLGSPIAIQTLYAPPATIVVDPLSGITVAISIQDTPSSATSPASAPDATEDVTPEPDTTEPTQAPEPPPTETSSDVLPTTSSEFSSESSSESSSSSSSSSSSEIETTSTIEIESSSSSFTASSEITSTSESLASGTASSETTSSSESLATGTAHPTLGGPINANTTVPIFNATYISGQSSMRKSGSSSQATLSFTSENTEETASASLTDILSSTFLSGVFTTTDSDGNLIGTGGVAEPTGGPGSGGSGDGPEGGDGNGSGGGSGSGDGGSGAADLSPQDKQVIGGVVGGVAGAALLIFLLLALLRYKRRKDGRAALEGFGEGTGTRGMITGRDGPDGSDGNHDMAERSAVPAAVAAALANLTGKRQPSNTPATAGPSTGAGERGFYRVSGRKLPSVLTAGGDGYTDPRDSAASGATDYYRGSQAFEPMSGPSTRLALGSPMRPTSGVVVMRSGPGKMPVTQTPVTERPDPFSDPFNDPPSPPPVHEPSGRLSTAHEGSPSSRSRFTEDI